MDTYFIDFETRSFRSIKDVGILNYMRHPTTSVLFMAYAKGNGKAKIWTPGKPWPKEILARPERIVVHYWNFEYNAFLHLLPQAPAWTRDLSLYDCTMNFSYRWGLPGAMADVARVLGFAEGKSGAGKSLIERFSLPQKPKKKRGDPEPPESEWYFAEPSKEELKEFHEYAKRDIEVTRRIYEVLPDPGPFERNVFELDKKMNTRGLLFDMLSVRKMKAKYDSDFQKAEEAAKKVAGVEDSGTLTVKSPAFSRWLAERKIEVPNLQKETLEEILEDSGIKKEVRDAIELRFMLNGAAVKKLDAILTYANEKGNAQNLLQYFGAHTGRWAGREVQPQNIPRECVSADEFPEVLKNYLDDGYEITEIPGIIRKLLRPLIVPGKGKVFYCSDLSAIEARVAFWLAQCNLGLQWFSGNIDIYVEFAQKIPFDSSNRGRELNAKQRRQVGKTAVLSLQYGAGVTTFLDALKKQAGIEDLELAEAVVQVYRKTFFEIPRFWNLLEDAFIKAIGTGESECGVLKFQKTKTSVRVMLPSGREMNFFKPRVSNGRLHLRHPIKGYRKAWGGVLLENFSSAVARDIICEKMLKVESQIAPVVLSVHDEVVAPGKKLKKKFQDFQEIMNSPVSWAPGLPIKASAVMLTRYGK